jgi:hypothetical protein
MSFEKGTIALTIFRLPEKLPENSLELYAAKAAIPYQDTGSEESVGWVSGRHLLERRIDEETSILGGAYHLHMRVTRRVVPATLQNALCREREIAYMRERSTDFVPKNVRKEIKEFVAEKHLKMIPPRLAGIPIAVDRVSNHLFVGSASERMVGMVESLFFDTFDINPIRLDFAELSAKTIGERDIQPKIDFSKDAAEDDFIPGRDFLTWLWYRSNTDQREFSMENGEFEITLTGPLTLSMVDPREGAGETVVKKGVPERSAEAESALSVGKKLKKAKLFIADKDRVWEGGFNADTFNFTGLKLPATEKGGDPHSVFEERLGHMRFLTAAMEAMVSEFLGELMSPDWDKRLADIQKWAAEDVTKF